MKASFVTLAAYDWRMLPRSIAAYYDYADEILIGLDANRISWSGVPFSLHVSELLAAIPDPGRKIRVVERDFCLHAEPMANDCFERERLAHEARNPWIVEIDADEFLRDVPALFSAMEAAPEDEQIYGSWVDVVKVIGNVALVADSDLRLVALATRSRSRKYARQTGERARYAPVEVLHFTTSRTEEDLARKLRSWSHSKQVRPDFLSQWRSVSLENYRAAKNLHPFIPEQWPALKAIAVSELQCQST